MSRLEYEVKRCDQCGAALPVRIDHETVTCRFCHSEYEVVRVHGQRINGQLTFSEGLLIGGIAGLVLGGVVFTAFGRATAKKAVSKAFNIAEAEITKRIG